MCAVFPGAGTWQATGKPHLGCFHSRENACLLAAVGTQLWFLICSSLCHRFLPLSSGEKHQGAVQSRPRGDQEVCPMVWFHDSWHRFMECEDYILDPRRHADCSRCQEDGVPRCTAPNQSGFPWLFCVTEKGFLSCSSSVSKGTNIRQSCGDLFVARHP